MRSFLFAAAAAGVGSLASSASADLAYAVTWQGTLISFDTSAPGVLLSGSAIQGLAANEVIRGIDFRPLNGQLYGLGSFGNLYTLNTVTGAASLVGGGIPLNGSSFGFDFNPTVDRIRVVSDTNQNLRVNPGDASTTVDGFLNYAAGGGDPNVIHAAYTNSFAGATSTTLYVIDETNHALYIQNLPNNGTLNFVGLLAPQTDWNDLGGFDIGTQNQAWAVMQPQSSSFGLLYSINLNTGQATAIGQIGGGAIITAFAVIPTPGTAALGLIGLAAFGRRRTR